MNTINQKFVLAESFVLGEKYEKLRNLYLSTEKPYLDAKKSFEALTKQRKDLIDRMRELWHDSLPFKVTLQIHCAYYAGSGNAVDFLYINKEDKTYYTKPLYSPDGTIYGNKVSKAHIKEGIEQLKQMNYVLAK